LAVAFRSVSPLLFGSCAHVPFGVPFATAAAMVGALIVVTVWAVIGIHVSAAQRPFVHSLCE
jgi:hypothetical protein